MKSCSFSLIRFGSLSAALVLASCQTTDKTGSVPETETPTAIASPTISAPVPPASTTPDASGWVSTASGLRYKVLSSGPAEGRSPTMFDSVMVHYRGTLTDGTVFDSSIERGTPATFGVGQVIPGWTEALRMMKPGDQWVLYIPSNLAYGSRAVGGKIPPNSDLIFQVALIQVL
ncbi:FKBP-type peptidyl-prolyl cis-trans isomerase [Prosthecobacter debontii]|uniref:Peptidyl-prolyl cis-trans isomerase n=1 Tax=Prosthecobacter debontii TaxID=48467 RepID=A0A1T4XKQ5_9BACT|nr:FKBP-type peptidyl-prolyl cis-trans isomerase [Prosthecobacter debontii]SKA89983.1 FKBP-type peptidyl-prolyl cis-trans isomerase [Prosthecobacter debontii]